MVERSDGQHMRECEARYWLNQGYISEEKVGELKERLAKQRGAQAVEALVEEMRSQWRRRYEWLGVQHG